MRTVWRGQFSRTFSVCNGIRQGGVISLLFCIYMHELLKRLEADGVGCWIGKYYYGGVGYADDLTLVVPSVRGLRQMLKICSLEKNTVWSIILHKQFVFYSVARK